RYRTPEGPPLLLAEETVAQQVAALDDELLALVALLLGELRVIVAERQSAERDVPRLVLHHVGRDRAPERIRGLVADDPEGGERDAFDEDLHAQVREVPARILQRVVEQPLEVAVDRVRERELLVQQARVRFDVPRLV